MLPKTPKRLTINAHFEIVAQRELSSRLFAASNLLYVPSEFSPDLVPVFAVGAEGFANFMGE